VEETVEAELSGDGAAVAVLATTAAGTVEAGVWDCPAVCPPEAVLLLLVPRGFSPVFRFASVSAEIVSPCALPSESRLWLMIGAAPLADACGVCANAFTGRAAAITMRSRHTPPILT